MSANLHFLKYFFGMLMLLVFVSSCKFPQEEIEKFDLNISANVINPIIQIKISTEDSIPAEKLTCFISGADTKWFYDIEGKTNFNAEGGSLYLILHPDAAPTLDNPLKVTINIIKEGYLPIRQEIVVSSESNKLLLNLTLKKLNASISGVYSKVVQLNYLGKKRVDSVFFEFVRPDGISFLYKMPTKGLVFLRSSNFKFQDGQQNSTIQNLFGDTNLYLQNLPNDPYKKVSSIILENSFLSSSGVPYAKELIPTSGTHIDSVLIGYKKPNLLAELKIRETFDTVALTNVRVQMVSESRFKESDFVDENGILQKNVHLFTDGVIGFPELTFFDAKSGTPLTPYYPDNIGGVLTEVLVPDNNYKLFAEGIGYSAVANYFFYLKKTVSLDPASFSLSNTGAYSFKFSNNYLRSKFFLFKSSNKGCDYKKITVNYPNLPLNNSFTGKLEVIQPGFKEEYELLFNEPEFQVLVGSLIDVTTELNVKVNHYYNSCLSGATNLAEESLAKVKLCEQPGNQLKYNVSFNGINYLSTIPKLEPLKASARVLCPSGNFVLPPTIDLLIWKEGCNEKKQLRIVDGKFEASNFIESNNNYIVRYDRISSAGKPTTVYDTLFFNPNIASQSIVDNVRGFWTGALNYSPAKGYELSFDLDNKRLKYPIPNCK